MPHCIIEYSKELEVNIAPGDLVDSVFKGVVNSGFVDPDVIKSRAIAYEYYRVGAAQSLFLHVSIRLLSGRPTEQRKSISEAVLAELRRLSINDVTITIEMLDMERASFAKGVQ